jgi:hypothetical protein
LTGNDNAFKVGDMSKMTTPNTSRFIAGKFVARAKYEQVFADRDALSERLMESIKALADCGDRRNSAEEMLKKLKFQREENGIWTNSEL